MNVSLCINCVLRECTVSYECPRCRPSSLKMADLRALVLQDLSSILTCPSCRQPCNSTSRVPMLLYCGHTLCWACLSSLPKTAQNHVTCPIDRLLDIRDFEDICESHHVRDVIEKVELCCLGNLNDPADFFCPETMETACANCARRTPTQHWIPIKDAGDLGAFYASEIANMLQNQQFKERVVKANPGIQERLKQLRYLPPKGRQSLYFTLMNRPIPILPKPREVEPKVDENGWVILKRFHNIIPEKYCTNFDQVRRWTLTQNNNQVEAVTFRMDRTIRLRGLSLCKECGNFAGCIEYIGLVEGAETHNSTVIHIAQRIRYTERHKQTEKVVLSRPIELLGNKDYTIKIKYTGQFLYFGDPSRRIDNLVGADGVKFKVSDPRFTNGEYQNGQGALAGPLVGLFYEPTAPIL